MPELPSGTVTFLFTDIEGSTRLLQELGEAYAEALNEHRRLLRETFARHRGVEVDTQGDAFFYVFARASDAIVAAAEAQDALVAVPVRVRMGLHTGEPQLTEEGYVGIEVHRAARIAAAGHGGQLLVSQATHELVGADVELRDLGVHRLKDLSQPERLYQLGEDEFPPLRSLSQTNLPIPATPLVGRSRELADLLGLLGRDDVRLLTMTGPGGTGKTRLALEAAADAAGDYENGVFWVPLAPLRDPALVLESVGRALSARRALAEEIGEKSLLLLLDNFEQVVDAAPALAELLGSCRNLNLLVTSRQPLHLAGERLYPVPPLAESEAVALFNERAQAVQPEFSTDGEVAEICLRLDGLPLAIELAAARVTVLPPRALLERLERRLPLLTRGARDAPERQRTLRATIEWSYELLTPEERELFERLAVFAGGCTLEAAEEVAKADLEGLQSLVEKSLLRRSDNRFLMLETIREYAFERLGESDAVSEIRKRHAEYYARLAEDIDAHIRSPEQFQLIEQLDLEDGNTRAALAWLLDSEPRRAHALALALSTFWYTRDRVSELVYWWDTVLGAIGETEPVLRAQALQRLGNAELFLGNEERATILYRESLSLAEQAGARREVAAVLLELGRSEEALPFYREFGDPHLLAKALQALGDQLCDEGDLARARELFEESLQIRRRVGSPWNLALLLHSFGDCALLENRLDEARDLYCESLRISRDLQTRHQAAYSLAGLAAVAAKKGTAESAVRLWGSVQTLETSLGFHLTRPYRPRYEALLDTLAASPDLAPAFRAGLNDGMNAAVELALSLE